MAIKDSILVVEDYQDMQDLVRLLLEREGYNVVSAMKGREALNYLSLDHKFCLIILDLTLPDMSALDILKALSLQKPGKTTPILLFSASDDVPQTHLPKAVVGKIRKPFEIDEFIQIVKDSKLTRL